MEKERVPYGRTDRDPRDIGFLPKAHSAGMGHSCAVGSELAGAPQLLTWLVLDLVLAL